MRSTRHFDHGERGTALLSVLLLVAVMSIAALAMVEGTTSSIQRAITADDRARLSWQALSAEQAGLIALDRLVQATNGAALTERTPGLGAPFETLVDGTIISTVLRDDSNCLNLNAVIADEAAEDATGGADEEAANINLRLYQTMLEAIDFSENDAETLAAALADWLDPDQTPRLSGAEDRYYNSLRPPYRTSGTLLANVSELRAIRGYTKEVFEVIEPLVCARRNRVPSLININTITLQQAPLLSMAMSGELTRQDAEAIIARRPVEGWLNMDEFIALNEINQIAVELRFVDQLGTQSSYLRLTSEINGDTYGEQFHTIFEVLADQPIRIHKRSRGDS